jgi:hypothetical protein
MAKQKRAQAEPDCCVNKGFHWDEAVLYTPHSRWGDEPTPVFWNGPVFRIASSLDRALNEQP